AIILPFGPPWRWNPGQPYLVPVLAPQVKAITLLFGLPRRWDPEFTGIHSGNNCLFSTFETIPTSRTIIRRSNSAGRRLFRILEVTGLSSSPTPFALLTWKIIQITVAEVSPQRQWVQPALPPAQSPAE
ncbi:hypothetical protein GALMADRAFT_148394, partial [Galerina marginata CBS 339.88]